MENIGKNFRTYVVFVLSYVFSLIVLNRWAFTHLKLKSFGVIWQYYVSWTDFGFFRRGLLGTLLTLSGLNRTMSNEYVFCYVFYGATLTACYCLLLNVMVSSKTLRHHNIIVLCVFFSPAMLSHFAYSTGCQDLILFLILLIVVFLLQNTIAFSLAVVAGVLTHELFLFLIPCIFVLKFLTSAGQPSWQDGKFVIPGLAVLCSIVIVGFFGQVGVPRSEFEGVMAARIPLAAHFHSLWSGYFAVSSGIESNMSAGVGVIKRFSELGWRTILIAVPTIYAIYVAFIAAAFSSLATGRAICLFLSVLFPIATIAVAGDYHRWTSISACLGLISMILLMSRNMLCPPRWSLVSLACFSILAPFGAAELERPFPMHQFLWEAVTRS